MLDNIKNVIYIPARVIGLFTAPKILVISIPKSGTHLILNILQQIPFLRFYRNPIFNYFPIERKKEMLGKGRKGHIIHGHLPFDEGINKLISDKHFKTMLMIRDPRDQVVSLAHYIVKISDRHRFGEYFTKVLRNNEDRIMACIFGMEGKYAKNGLPLLDLDTRYRLFLKWLERGDVFLCRFEEFIGSKGGGDDRMQLDSVKRLFEFLEISINNKKIERIAKSAFSKKTSTFRKGQIGDWRNHLSFEHKEEIKRNAGNLLIELGYEKDMNW